MTTDSPSSSQKQPASAPSHDVVSIDLGARSYDIHIGAGLCRNMVDYLPFSLQGRKIFMVSDSAVDTLHGAAVVAAIEAAGGTDIDRISIPAGEQSKSFQTYETLLNRLLEQRVSRDSVLFAVGGGVIGDLGGFVAATILRGIPFIQIPTTLLAQVDSAVGGKTGINTRHGKNLVGAFYQPRAVLADAAMLATLPERQMRAGYAEILKYALIDDPAFFDWLAQHGMAVIKGEADALSYAVAQSCRKKAAIVIADEREKGMRALLNLGHTFGHAFEAAAGYDGRLLHGEAVAAGMVCAFRLSHRLGLCAAEDVLRVEHHLAAAGLPVDVRDALSGVSTDAARLYDIMTGDKKVDGGRINFILARGIGQAFITPDVERNDVIAILERSLNGA